MECLHIEKNNNRKENVAATCSALSLKLNLLIFKKRAESAIQNMQQECDY
jgi:hypothetical protein